MERLTSAHKVDSDVGDKVDNGDSIEATSMWVMDVGDEICWWQLWDVLVTDLIHKIANIMKKTPT